MPQSLPNLVETPDRNAYETHSQTSLLLPHSSGKKIVAADLIKLRAARRVSRNLFDPEKDEDRKQFQQEEKDHRKIDTTGLERRQLNIQERGRLRRTPERREELQTRIQRLQERRSRSRSVKRPQVVNETSEKVSQSKQSHQSSMIDKNEYGQKILENAYSFQLERESPKEYEAQEIISKTKNPYHTYKKDKKDYLEEAKQLLREGSSLPSSDSRLHMEHIIKEGNIKLKLQDEMQQEEWKKCTYHQKKQESSKKTNSFLQTKLLIDEYIATANYYQVPKIEKKDDTQQNRQQQSNGNISSGTLEKESRKLENQKDCFSNKISQRWRNQNTNETPQKENKNFDSPHELSWFGSRARQKMEQEGKFSDQPSQVERGISTSPLHQVNESYVDNEGLSIGTSATMYSSCISSSDSDIKTVGRLGSSLKAKHDLIKNETTKEKLKKQVNSNNQICLINKINSFDEISCVDQVHSIEQSNSTDLTHKFFQRTISQEGDVDEDSTFSVSRKTINALPGQYMPIAKRKNSTKQDVAENDHSIASSKSVLIERLRSSQGRELMRYYNSPSYMDKEEENFDRRSQSDTIFPGSEMEEREEINTEPTMLKRYLSCTGFDHSSQEGIIKNGQNNETEIVTDGFGKKVLTLHEQLLENKKSWQSKFIHENNCHRFKSTKKSPIKDNNSLKENSQEACIGIGKDKIKSSARSVKDTDDHRNFEQESRKHNNDHLMRERMREGLQIKEYFPQDDLTHSTQSISVVRAPCFHCLELSEDINDTVRANTDQKKETKEEKTRQERLKLIDLRSGKLNAPLLDEYSNITGKIIDGTKKKDKNLDQTRMTENLKEQTDDKEMLNTGILGGVSEILEQTKKTIENYKDSMKSHGEKNIYSLTGIKNNYKMKPYRTNLSLGVEPSILKTETKRGDNTHEKQNLCLIKNEEKNSKRTVDVQGKEKNCNSPEFVSSKHLSDGHFSLSKKSTSSFVRKNESSSFRTSNISLNPMGIDRNKEKLQKFAENFPLNIRQPSMSQTTYGEISGYLVWCSHGFQKPIPGFSWTPPPKMFDTSFCTIEKANERAQYLFYWRNPFRINPQLMVEFYDFGESLKKKCKSFQCTLIEGGRTWKVSVVPSEVFEWLDYADSNRHPFDEVNILSDKTLQL